MRTDFVGHATLLVRHGGLTVLTDPWWMGPAYRGQWFPYPLPVPERYDLSAVDAVYISHGHEDHLHRGTLAQVLERDPDVLAVIPRRAETGMRDYLRRIGFRRIRELPSGVGFTLRKGGDQMRLTIHTHLDDSMLAVEAGGEVLLNANDALHAARGDVIEEYCRMLRRRYPRLDYLFCGFGGASYFPNCISVPGKDDRAVAYAREEFFLRNFALITERLQPRYAFPFAAHFVLPDPRVWWISESRLSMPSPAATVRDHLGQTATTVVDLQPGDGVEDGVVFASPAPVLSDPEQARTAVLARYAQRAEPAPLTAQDFGSLIGEVRGRAEQYARATPDEQLDALLVLWDYPASAIRVRVERGAATVTDVAADAVAISDASVVFETRSDLVRSTMQSPYGRDLITIGYAAHVRLRSRLEMGSNTHERLLNLLSPPQPRWRELFRRHPERTLSFVVGDLSLRYGIKSRLGVARTYAVADQPALYGIGDWAAVAQTAEG